jgi:hypothetical protein
MSFFHLLNPFYQKIYFSTVMNFLKQCFDLKKQRFAHLVCFYSLLYCVDVNIIHVLDVSDVVFSTTGKLSEFGN